LLALPFNGSANLMMNVTAERSGYITRPTFWIYPMNFNLVFSTIVSLTILSGSTAVAVSAQTNLNPQQESIVDTCTDTWKLGIGAIIGLLGGRNLPGEQKDDDDNENE
jgi:hypothetical protein